MSEQTWGGMSSVELAALIAGVGLAILLIIVLINVAICRCRTKETSSSVDGDQERMVSMQTDRTVNGQSMKQVIVKSKPNGNMDKYNQNSIAYQTMDPETNTVRYETATHSQQQEPETVMISFHGSNGSDTKVVTTEAEDIDSGTGASPERRTSVDVYSEEGAQEHTNEAFEELEEEIPHTISYPMPPPPETLPPPLTPGTQVTDLDADNSDDDDIPAPPPPPPPMEPLYAQLNKNRSVSEKSAEPTPSTEVSENMRRSGWRPSAEIEIIEREKF